MHGSYRRIILAAFVGLATLGNAQAKQQQAVTGDARPKQHKREPQQSDFDRAGFPRLVEEAISNPEPDEGTAREKRDLAAQEATATWAFWMIVIATIQSVLSAIGIFFIVQTLRQGRLSLRTAFSGLRQAARQARASEMGLAHAKDVSDAELRPWVSIKVVAHRILKKGHGLSFEYDVVFENLGKTVAKSLQMHFRLDFLRPNGTGIGEWWERWKEPKVEGPMLLMPGERYTFPSWAHRADASIPWHGDPADYPRNASPVVVATAFYKSNMDASWHRTNRAFTLGMRGEGLTRDYVSEDAGNLGPEQVVARAYSGPVAT